MSKATWKCRFGFHQWGRWSTVRQKECTVTVFGQVPSLDRFFPRVVLATQEKFCERCGIAVWRALEADHD